MIRKALEVEDELVTEVVRRAAEVLGYACVNVRHLLDPEAIVLGGGVIEACSDFIMPIVENIVGLDPLPGAREGGRVLLSALGDDAVALGAVAAARKLVGRSPFKKRFHVKPKYPGDHPRRLRRDHRGQEDLQPRHLHLRRRQGEEARRRSSPSELYGSAHTVGPKELEEVCQGGPEVLFIGAGMSSKVELTEDARRFLPNAPSSATSCPPPRPPKLQPLEAPQSDADPRHLLRVGRTACWCGAAGTGRTSRGAADPRWGGFLNSRRTHLSGGGGGRPLAVGGRMDRVYHGRDFQEHPMPNIAAVLKDEIRRLARKELKASTKRPKQILAHCRRDIASLKRMLQEQQKKLTFVGAQSQKQGYQPDPKRKRRRASATRSDRCGQTETPGPVGGRLWPADRCLGIDDLQLGARQGSAAQGPTCRAVAVRGIGKREALKEC